MTIRVVQWATGRGRGGPAPRGHRPSRPRARRPVRLQPGEGRRRRRRARRPPADRRRSRPNDKAAILALDADVVLHAASKAFPRQHATPTTSSRCSSRARTSSPRRRTTTCRRTAPTPTTASDARAHEAGTRFHAAGEHPGFMFERLATVAHRAVAAGRQDHRAGVRRLLRRVRRGRCSSTSWAWASSPRRSRSSRRCSARCPCSTSRRSAATADVLGLRARRDPPRRSRPATVASRRRGRVRHAARRHRSSVRSCRGPAYRDGAPVLVAEEYWTVTDDIPGWDLVARRPVPRARHRRRGAPLRSSSRSATTRPSSRESRAVSSRWR